MKQFYVNQIIKNSILIILCLALIGGIITWMCWPKEKDREVISLKEFRGRIMPEEETIKNGAFKTIIPFEDALKSGSEAVLTYSNNKIEIIRPDTITKGLWQIGIKKPEGHGAYLGAANEVKVFTSEIIITREFGLIWYTLGAIVIIATMLYIFSELLEQMEYSLKGYEGKPIGKDRRGLRLLMKAEHYKQKHQI